MMVRTRQDLVAHRIAVHPQLLAVQLHTFSGAIGLFSALDIAIGLAFLRQTPTQTKAAWLSERRMRHWLFANGYCGRHTAARLVEHPQSAPAEPTATTPATPTRSAK